MAESAVAGEIMTDVFLSRFHQPLLLHHQVHVCGGLMDKAMPMTTKTLRVKTSPWLSWEQQIFVKFDLQEKWLPAAVTALPMGQVTHKHFAGTSLVEKLRQHVQRACDGGVAVAVPRAFIEEEGHDHTDDTESPRKRIKDGSGRERGRGAAWRSIVEIDLPEHHPEVAEDADEVRMIRLFIANRRQVWLHIDDVPWGMKWMYVQFAAAASDSSDSAVAESS